MSDLVSIARDVFVFMDANIGKWYDKIWRRMKMFFGGRKEEKD
jgi:hypothetical protein